jgi:hypothetical protein
MSHARNRPNHPAGNGRCLLARGTRIAQVRPDVSRKASCAGWKPRDIVGSVVLRLLRCADCLPLTRRFAFALGWNHSRPRVRYVIRVTCAVGRPTELASANERRPLAVQRSRWTPFSLLCDTNCVGHVQHRDMWCFSHVMRLDLLVAVTSQSVERLFQAMDRCPSFRRASGLAHW